MKKFLSLLIACTMILSVVGCKKKEESLGDKLQNAKEQAEEAAKDAEKEVKKAVE